jgi:hypothetical protein
MADEVITFGLQDPKNIQLANDLAKYREGVLGSYAAAKASQAASAAALRQKAEDDLRKQYEAIPDQNKILPDKSGLYPAIDHDFKAAAKRIEFNHQRAMIDPNDTAADTRLKMLNEALPVKERQDFIDTDLYKNAVQENTSNKERVTMANNLHDQLLKMKAAIDKGDMVLAANIGKTGLMKSVNSMQGKDAVSPSEQNTRYQDLLSFPDILIQNTQGQSVAQQLLSRMAIAYGKDKKEFNSLSDQFTGLIKGSIEADPVQFYKTVYELHNAAVDTADRNVDRVVNMTSPYHAKLMQANKPQRLPAEAALGTQMVNTGTQYAQTAPIGIPVSTGAASTTSGTVTTGTSQAAPSGVDPALLDVMRKKGLIK